MMDFNGGMVAFKLLILRADTVLMTQCASTAQITSG
jgi:hypothetical protein